MIVFMQSEPNNPSFDPFAAFSYCHPTSLDHHLKQIAIRACPCSASMQARVVEPWLEDSLEMSTVKIRAVCKRTTERVIVFQSESEFEWESRAM